MKLLYQYLLATTLCTIMVAQNTYSQKRPKYEDELTRILNSAPSEGLAVLKIYLAEDPLNPSIHLQMGLIYETRFKDADFLTEYLKATGNAREAISSLGKAAQYIEEKTVKRNKEQYVNFAVFDQKGKYEVRYDSVKKRIDTSLQYADDFLAHIPGIYSDFTASYSHYEQAQKVFTSIVGRYKSLKELYLLYDSQLEDELDKMSMHYDSSLYHFEKYKSATSAYPLRGYEQKMNFQEIVIYRLDGLEVEVNFLLADIRIWNYKKWAQELKSYVNINITKLRSDLATNEIDFNSRIGKVDEEYKAQVFEPLRTNKETMFNLKKYDLSSVIEPLFLYKEAKHNLLYNKLLISSLDSASEIETDRKLFLYGQMINRIREADSILTTVKVKNTPESYQKYKPFIDQYYSGMGGITKYVNTEQLDNRRDFTDYIASLSTILLDKYSIAENDQKVVYRKVVYSQAETEHPSDSLASTGPVTTHVVENFDGSFYLGGVQQNAKEKKLEAFVLKLDPAKNVKWLKTFLLQSDSTAYDAHTRLGAMQTTQEGVLLVLNGKHVESGGTLNHLLLLDETGDILLTKRLLFSDFPRGIFYHEKTNTYLITFKGETPELPVSVPSDLIIANHNILGDLNWQYRINYAGTYERVVSVEDGFILAGNFSTLKSADGRLIKAGNDALDMAPVVLKMDFEGKLVSSKPLSGSAPYFGKNLIRVSDLCLNLIGVKGKYVASPFMKDQVDSSFHIILDANLNILSSNMD